MKGLVGGPLLVGGLGPRPWPVLNSALPLCIFGPKGAIQIHYILLLLLRTR